LNRDDLSPKIFSLAINYDASLIVDYRNLRGHLPHKTFALASGLGWIGRNLLLINPIYGP